MIPQKHKWAGVLLLPLLSVLTGCATQYYAVSNSPKEDGGIYRIEEGAEYTPPFTDVKTLNYLIEGPNGKLFYGTVGKLPESITNEGGVALFMKKSDGTFDVVRTVPVNAQHPCHLTLSPDGRHLYTANYTSGTISEMPVIYGIPRIARLIYHAGKGKTPRQTAPHPHFVGFDPAGTSLFVADLGTDEIRVYEWIIGQGIRRQASDILKLHPGAGPRHLVFAPESNVLYVANELDSTVSSFLKNKVTSKWTHVLTQSTLTDQNVSKNAPGAILITRDGRFFFVTNRGHNSIALFETSGNGQFKLVQVVPAGGDFPSDLALTSNEKQLIVANMNSGTVTHFQFDRNKKTLTLLPETEKVPRVIRVISK